MRAGAPRAGRNRTLVIVWTLGWTVVAACSGRPAVQTDQPAEWALTPSEFEVGGQTSDERYVLSRVVGATLLPDGRVAIADGFANGVRLYDASGTHLRTVGGPGEGPGEYEFVRGMGPCARDRVVVFDLHWGWTIYDLDLTLLEERSPLVPGLGGSAYQYACTPDGTFIASGWGDAADVKEGLHIATAPIVVGRGDTVLLRLEDRSTTERVGYSRDGRPADTGPHPFGRETQVAIGRDRFYIGGSDAYRVDVFDHSGTPLAPIEWEGPALTLTPELIAAFEASRLAASPEAGHAEIRRWVRELPPLDTRAAYDAIVVDRSDDLWVRDFLPRPDGARTWWVFGSAGSLVATLSVAANQRLLEIGDAHVLIVETDDFGVETVRLVSLDRRAPE